MEFQIITNLLDNRSNQLFKLRRKSWIEINDDARRTYNIISGGIKFKTSMIKSSLCDYSDAYTFECGTITVVGGGADDAARSTDINKKQAIFKNCAPFIDCATEVNSTLVEDNAQNLLLLCQCFI